MPIIAVPRARSRYGMIVETTAGRIVNAACAQAVARASTGTTAQMFGIQIATTSPTPNSATSRPTNAIAAGGLRRNNVVGAPARDRDRDQGRHRDDRRDDTALERVEAQLVVEVQVQEERRR